MADIDWKNGQWDGEWKIYNEDGTLKSIFRFKEGKPVLE